MGTWHGVNDDGNRNGDTIEWAAARARDHHAELLDHRRDTRPPLAYRATTITITAVAGITATTLTIATNADHTSTLNNLMGLFQVIAAALVIVSAILTLGWVQLHSARSRSAERDRLDEHRHNRVIAEIRSGYDRQVQEIRGVAAAAREQGWQVIANSWRESEQNDDTGVIPLSRQRDQLRRNGRSG